MPMMTLTAYAATHEARKQSAAEWKAKDLLVMKDGLVDAEASDVKMEARGLGRFRYKGHGGRRAAGVHGAIDRPGLKLPISAQQEPDPWIGWHRLGNSHTIAEDLRRAIGSDDEGELSDAINVVEFAAWDDACKDAGWRRWATDVAPKLAADLRLPPDEVKVALEQHVAARLTELGVTEADLRDARLRPR